VAWSLPDDCVLAIFGEKPEPGGPPQFRDGGPRIESRSRSASLEVGAHRSAEGHSDHLKKGLVAEWGVEAAAVLQQAMLFDTLDIWDSESVLAPGGRRVLLFAPSDAGPWFDALLPASFALQPQVGGDTGQCLQAFLGGEFEEGASRVVMIGSDSPTLDPTIVVSAFLCLEGRDLVLGPATDGGLYLIGARGSVPPIFDGIDWNRPNVLSQVVDRLKDTGLSLSLLPPWYRINQSNDVRMLAGHIRALRRAGLDPAVPRVERLIEREWLARLA
jgi:glycosyltransferase A (GT-A) superfamily protein (DUF2064 family)